MVDRSPKYQKLNASVVISFGEEDYEEVQYPHDDALVVALLVANCTTMHILIDNDS